MPRPDEKVRTSTTDWRSECLKADAADALDTAQAGVVAVESTREPAAYVFSNGRKFQYGRKPGS